MKDVVAEGPRQLPPGSIPQTQGTGIAAEVVSDKLFVLKSLA